MAEHRAVLSPASTNTYVDRFDQSAMDFIEKRCGQMMADFAPDFGADPAERDGLLQAAYAQGFADAFDGLNLFGGENRAD